MGQKASTNFGEHIVALIPVIRIVEVWQQIAEVVSGEKYDVGISVFDV